VERDVVKAALLSRQGCDGGVPMACRNLAAQYERGEEIGQDLEIARTLYQQACTDGDQPSCDAVKRLSTK
jgi:TPR repeat protein